MRILHTSDWHLGHELAGFDRRQEHARFLAFLAATIEEEAIDVLLVTGDIFDVQTPPASAQEMLYAFLVDVHRRRPTLRTVLLGGNHDSAARLEAPHPFATPLGITVVGALPRPPAGDGPRPLFDEDRCLVPLPSARAPAAILLAIPFLRSMDLPTPGPGDGDVHATPFGVRAIYREALARAEARWPGVPKIAAGHLYVVGVKEEDLSLDTERPILGGHQHAVPADVFPPSLAYVALGHLHKPQKVGRETVRYAGSPIPLSFTERTYKHAVVVVALTGATADVRTIVIPRSVPFVAVPSKRPQLKLGTGSAYGTKELVLAELAALDDVSGLPEDLRPFLAVSIVLDRPDVAVKEEIRRLIAPKGYRLVALTEAAGAIRRDDVQVPERVTRRLPTPRELLEQVFDARGLTLEPELVALFAEAEQAVLEAPEEEP